VPPNNSLLIVKKVTKIADKNFINGTPLIYGKLSIKNFLIIK